MKLPAFLTASPLASISAAALLLAAGSGIAGYVHGLNVASARAAAARLRTLDANAAATARLQKALDAATARAVVAEAARQTTAREIRDEITSLTADPQYRRGCIDAAGLRLLERAAAVANAAP